MHSTATPERTSTSNVNAPSRAHIISDPLNHLTPTSRKRVSKEVSTYMEFGPGPAFNSLLFPTFRNYTSSWSFFFFFLLWDLLPPSAVQRQRGVALPLSPCSPFTSARRPVPTTTMEIPISVLPSPPPPPVIYTNHFLFLLSPLKTFYTTYPPCVSAWTHARLLSFRYRDRREKRDNAAEADHRISGH